MIDNCTTNYLVIVLVVQFFSVVKQIENNSQNVNIVTVGNGSVYKNLIKMQIKTILIQKTVALFVNRGTIKVKC